MGAGRTFGIPTGESSMYFDSKQTPAADVAMMSSREDKEGVPVKFSSSRSSLTSTHQQTTKTDTPAYSFNLHIKVAPKGISIVKI